MYVHYDLAPQLRQFCNICWCLRTVDAELHVPGASRQACFTHM